MDFSLTKSVLYAKKDGKYNFISMSLNQIYLDMREKEDYTDNTYFMPKIT